MSALLAARAPRLLLAAAAGMAAAVAFVLWPGEPEARNLAYVAACALAAIGGMVYLAWNAEPAWSLTVGIGLAIFLGQWKLPAGLAPDRIVLLTAVAAIIFRAPGARFRPRIEVRPVHWLLAAGVVYAALSAAAVGTLFEQESLFVLIERYGVLPYLLFLCAPAAFHTARQRAVLLGGLIAIGGYLGLIAVLQGIGADELVFPAYIADPSIGTHEDRARGPFLEAGTNGLVLFVCGAAAAVAATTWRAGWGRRAAVVVLALCAAGVVFTLTRQVWLGAALGTVAAMAVAPGARRYMVPVLAGLALGAAGLLVTVPGLADKASERREQQGPIHDRYNQAAAAINAVEEKPLVGVGWQNFVGNNADYVELHPDRPLSGTTAPVHNVPLTYASELGLIGASLWLAGFVFGVGGALRRRVVESALAMKALLAGAVACYAVVANFAFATSYPNLLIWLLAGVVLGAAPRPERAPMRERLG